MARRSVALLQAFGASTGAISRLSLTFSLVLFAAGSSRAGDDLDKKANHILERVSKLETFQSGDPKHQRELRFRLVRAGSPEADGVVTIRTDSPTLWREDTDFDNYHSSELRIKNHLWFKSTHDFLPLVVQELQTALRLPVLRMGHGNSVKRIYEREIDGVLVRCIEFESVRGHAKFENEVCVQRDTGYLMWAHYDATQASFSEFLSAGGIVVPRRIAIDLEGNSKIVAELSEELVQKFDAKEFVPPDGAEMSDVCMKGSSPTPRYTPDPVAALVTTLNISHGRVTGVLKVDADGSVVNEAIVQSLSPVLDKLALATVKQWKYAPATCNGKPVKAVTQFSVTY